MMHPTLGLVIAVKHTHLKTLARDRTKNDGMKRLGRSPVHTAPHAGLEPACICIRIKVMRNAESQYYSAILPVLVILVAQ